MFSKVLIANRGEIACRVIRTLRTMGIASVAVYSDADAEAKHVREADEAVHLGPTNARESYLSIEKVIAAARRTGAQAIHPGYGFLAENAAFAQACADAGITFIGPSAHAIETMGDKISAKIAVSAAGVPVVPGRSEPGMSDDALVAAAADIGLPVLIKPSAGGGGKGMYLVEHEGELLSSIAAARREAASSFGDDTLFVERFVTDPRHIEVQVLADTHGTTIHLGERECSLQRRHQKIIEEAPSVLLDDATRARIGQAAVDTAAAVAYSGAGTVEFIVSADRPEEFYFMEMNTRLQVEHPVTEMVTGIDLVEQQIRVAAGEALQLAQEDVELRGHSIEARIYAENPDRDFLPTGGTVLALDECSEAGPVLPPSYSDLDGPHDAVPAVAPSAVRIDSALIEGHPVATTYDPMVAKVIVQGADRAEALERLDEALSNFLVFGVTTNVQFLRSLVTHPRVLSGELDTGLVAAEIDSLVRRPTPVEIYAAVAAAYVDAQVPAEAADPWESVYGWRPGRAPVPMHFSVKSPSGERIAMDALVVDDGTDGQGPLRLQLQADGAQTEVEVYDAYAGEYLLRVDGGIETRARLHVTDSEIWAWVEDHGTYLLHRLSAEQELGTHGSAADGQVRSPMPGTVIAVEVEDGAEVAEGDPLAVVEAMKMEHVLRAPVAGTVSDLAVTTGSQVAVDELLLTVTPTDVAPTE